MLLGEIQSSSIFLTFYQAMLCNISFLWNSHCSLLKLLCLTPKIHICSESYHTMGRADQHLSVSGLPTVSLSSNLVYQFSLQSLKQPGSLSQFGLQSSWGLSSRPDTEPAICHCHAKYSRDYQSPCSLSQFGLQSSWGLSSRPDTEPAIRHCHAKYSEIISPHVALYWAKNIIGYHSHPSNIGDS